MKRKLAGFLILVITVLVLLPLVAQAIMVEPDDNTCMYGGEHSWSDWRTSEEATCTGTGIRERVCNVCFYSQQQVIPALGHSWGEWGVVNAATCTTPGNSVRMCPRCGAEEGRDDPALGHEMDAGVITTPASCTTTGVKTYTCLRCGLTTSESIPAIGHTPTALPAVPATCTTGGKTEGSQCSVCGAILTAQADTPALGHAMDGGAVTTAATCTSAGVKTYTCTRCGMTTTETIPATGHTPAAIPGIPATCTESGLTEGSKCSVCGAILTEQAYTPALGHDYEATEYKEATATEDGYIRYVCSRCWDSYTETISKVPHDHTYAVASETPAACTSEGVRTYTCTICGNSYSESIPALGHAPQALPGKASTCTETGLTEGSVCSRCGVVLAVQTAIPAIGHNWGAWYTVKEATATEDGWMQRICQNDASHTEQAMIPATGEEAETEKKYVLKGYTSHVSGKAREKTDNLKAIWAGEVPVSYDPNADREVYNYNIQEAGIYLFDVPVPDAYDGNYIEHYLGAVSNAFLVNGRTYYSYGIVGNRNNDHSIDFTQVDPSQVDIQIEGFQVELLSIEPFVIGNNGKDAVRFNIAMTCLDGVEANPKLDIVWLHDNVVDATHVYPTTNPGVLDAKDRVYPCFETINNGNVPLTFYVNCCLSNGETYSYEGNAFLTPGDSSVNGGMTIYSVGNYITPGTETEDLLGTVSQTFWATGHDPVTGEQLCETEHITRTWEVAKDGTVTPKPDPGRSQLEVFFEEYSYYSEKRADPAGYQLNEHWMALPCITNVGPVDVTDYVLHIDYVAADETRHNTFSYCHSGTDGSSWFEGTNSTLAGGEVLKAEYGYSFLQMSPYGLIKEEDVSRGYLCFRTSVKWIDPETGAEREAHSEPFYLPVISKTGLLLQKNIEHGPDNGEYFQEGESIPWTLTVTNNSKETITNVTVTDEGVIVGTFAEIAAGDTVSCSVPPHVVTEYEAKVAGTVSNIATAVGTDLKGVEHSYPSNPVSVPTSKFSPTPLPTPDDTDKDGGGGGTEDTLPPGTPETPDTPGTPGGGEDPLGPTYGVSVGATVYKTTAHGPKNEKWYDEGEPVDYTITVKNIGEVAIKNLKLYDSLGGLAPIDTWPSLAPNEEHTFTFQWVVNSDNIGDGYVVNQATLTYTFLGVNGTPMNSNPVYVIAGEDGHLPIDGLITGEDGETPEIPHFPGLTGGGDTPLSPVIGPDGSPVTGPDGTPILAPTGTTVVLDESGSPVLSPFGTPVMMLPDGTYFTITPDGDAILTDKDGNPILDKNGNYIYINLENLAYCQMALEILGETEARYTLHACMDHKAAAEAAEAALQAGNAAEACRIWTEEIEKLYETLYEAGDGEGKAAIIAEKTAFEAYAENLRALAGDKAVAEALRIKCARLCCVIHTAPENLPETLAAAYTQLTGGSGYAESARRVGELLGYDSEMKEEYGAAEAPTLADVIALLRSTSSWNYDNVFGRGQKMWQMVLDRRVNAEYKAADAEGRKVIAAWRVGLDTLSASEKALTEMLYEGNEAVSAEIIMNLYKDAVFDDAKRNEADEGAKVKEFVARCYRYALGREGSEGEIASWAAMVTDGGRRVEDIARDILGSVEFQSRNLSNEEIVKALYRIYFDRDADEGGLTTWVGVLDRGEGIEAVEAGLAGSEEFKAVMGE